MDLYIVIFFIIIIFFFFFYCGLRSFPKISNIFGPFFNCGS